MNLNDRAAALCQSLASDMESLRISLSQNSAGSRIVDCGVDVPGGFAAGILMARVCLADLGAVEVIGPRVGKWPLVFVSSEQPLLACLASQYAGWEIKGEKYFAMGSGPMRAAAAREPLFADLGYRESAKSCIGVLESGKLPPPKVCEEIAAKCGVTSENLTLLVAPTRSTAGTLQIVARSLETALHKLHELKFDLNRVVSGSGWAPLPPLTTDDLQAIGRTNDAILFGGRVMLNVRGDDASLEEIGPQVPSCTSPDFGRPFAEVLAAYDHDFYQVDPLLFSPAEIRFLNLDTGSLFRFGQINVELLEQSFGEGSA